MDPALNYIDPDVARNADNITYLLRGKFADLRAGTYCVYTYFVPKTGKINGFNNPVALALKTFQVGTAAEEPKVATNCTDCHGDSIMHLMSRLVIPPDGQINSMGATTIMPAIQTGGGAT